MTRQQLPGAHASRMATRGFPCGRDAGPTATRPQTCRLVGIRRAFGRARGELVRRDLRLVLGAVMLSDDPDWLTEPDLELVEVARGTDTAVAA
jgi:hypothetical protein